ncbi:MAG: low specificity L-threonine aldolase [Myxococcales bacterium]|nr:low specificity L-threonine aldolase [Myxococcales bacterium]
MAEIIDLRSDTVTKPGPGMRKAMHDAEVGDDVFGDDPTINRLQERVAALLGKEAAIWTPTGTMANQIALGSFAGQGDEVICDRGAHVVNYEGGAISALWGAQSVVLDGPRGIFGPQDVTQVLRRGENDHFPRQKVVAMENTHNRGGGSVWPLQRMRAVEEVARGAGLGVHLDGARLWNAHVASGVKLTEYGAVADTVSVCLSKGLGAPAGSLVASTKERVTKMRRLRKRLGGGLRQAGVLAAAGMYALDHHIERLAEDHRNARKLAELLRELPGFSCDPREVETNLLFVDVEVKGGSRALVAAAKAQGVLFNAEGSGERIRLVTHLDVPAASIPEAVSRIRRAVASL